MEGKEKHNTFAKEDILSAGRRDVDSRKKALGRLGEDIAASLLESMGMMVLHRNVRCGAKELDIVCLAPNAAKKGVADIRIVEVKSRQEPLLTQPLDAVNHKKQQNLFRAAKAYLASAEFRSLRLRYEEILFDIVTVVWNEKGTEYRTEYIPDAFRFYLL